MPRKNEIDYLSEIAANTGSGGPSGNFYDPRGSTSSVTTFPAVANSVASEVLKPSNGNRKLLSIYNEGPGVLLVLLGAGTASASNYSVRVTSGDYLELDTYTGTVTGIFLTSGVARVTEIAT